MAEDWSERQELKWAISVLRDWSPRKMPSEVESVFLELEDVDLSRNADLWETLRRTLAENEALREPELLRYIENPERAARGYWWYDPEQWTPVQA